MNKLTRTLALVSTAAAFTFATCDASAAVIKITCEKRANRSKVSIDGSNLAPGSYKARIISGANRKTSDVRVSIGDEVEFDFDSATGEAGATKIPANFIVNSQVIGKILDPQGRTVVSDIEQCRTR
ncbi:MAG: hypothetical protein FJ189_03335 [Gammaproteobacteria bacterium]|nr:hypothetical protein [Gammaproteobacteria bacterium]